MTESSTQPELQPAARLRGVSAYAPPAPRWAIDLRLDSNEGRGPSAEVLDAIRSIDAEAVRRYPDAGPIEAKIAEKWGIDAPRVILTNGGDDAIDRVCRAAVNPGDRVVTHAPSFEMIARSARLSGAEVTPVRWVDGDFPEREFLDAITPGVSLVALVTPNNPTGAVIDSGTIARVIDVARAVGAFVLLDLAYVEFADADPTRDALDRDNVVIVRTFSKAWGLAGLRVGYALAPALIAPCVRAAGGPYAVSSTSLVAINAALSAQNDDTTVRAIKAEREQLTELCARLGLSPLESRANFVTLTGGRSRWIYESLGSQGVGVRLLERPEAGMLCRITLPMDNAAFRILLNRLEIAAAPEALLLDLDGVLADVSGSYRAAIIATARSFGVDLDPGAIALAKAVGDANNDWDLTRRLLSERGVNVPQPEVVAAFQRVYLGREGVPGLRETERLIVSPELVERLSARLPLAIVTGRPRAEAEWFLERVGIRGCFDALVAMEDAPPKPSPDPVRIALERLGVRRAWMVGDTPDDALAARRAGVVPIGVLAPGDGATSGDALERAGVARILNHLAELEGLLP